jgi:ADP-heptose:LPS heptosyltransferase
MSKKTVIIRHSRAVGDILVMTAVVRDIYKAYSDRFEIGVETPFMELWENNPYIIKLKNKRLGASVDLKRRLALRCRSQSLGLTYTYQKQS